MTPPMTPPSIPLRFELVCEVGDEPDPDAVCERVGDELDPDAVCERVDDEPDPDAVGDKVDCNVLVIVVPPITSGVSERHKKMRVWTEPKCLTPPTNSAAVGSQLSDSLDICKDTVDENS